MQHMADIFTFYPVNIKKIAIDAGCCIVFDDKKPANREPVGGFAMQIVDYLSSSGRFPHGQSPPFKDSFAISLSQGAKRSMSTVGVSKNFFM